MNKVKTRAVGILINDNKVLLIHRTRDGKEFWVFPGGGQEDGETVEEAVVREIEEDASIKCKTDRLLYKHIYSNLDNQEHHFYLCKYISGLPKLASYNEFHNMQEEDQSFVPKWIDITKISNMLLYPLEIRDWLIEDVKNNFKDTPRTETLSTDKLRQVP